MSMALRTMHGLSLDGSQQKITDALSKYSERLIDDHGTVCHIIKHDRRFLHASQWTCDLFSDIPQFQEALEKDFYRKNKPVRFEFPGENLNLEIRYIAYQRLFNSEWSLSNFFGNQHSQLGRAARFIRERYPSLHSFLDLDIELISEEWCAWLQSEGTQIIQSTAQQIHRIERIGRGYLCKTALANLLPNLCKWLRNYLDEREEWEKDGWDVRNLEKYGITYNKTAVSYYMYFDYIYHPVLRACTKKYIRQKLVNGAFAWNTAKMYMSYLPMFFNLITELEPEWNDLRLLERSHILKYIEYLNTYIHANLSQSNANPEQYKNRGLTIVHKFLSDIQLYEDSITPVRDVRTLIFQEDKPKIPKKAYDKTDYIPDFVLDQLFAHINDLHPDAVPVIWVMYKTGFRVSDALLLKQDCLLKLNGKYWLETDIKKTFVKGHRVPIDDKLAGIIARLIELSKQNSNQYNNPDGFIFARLSGSRRGRPIGQYLIREYLNSLAYIKNIVDEKGDLYHFTNHAFRHTYAVKLLNGGADIVTIQELMAHASPEMTMRYARLLDDTKRKVFDHLLGQGVFSFDDDCRLVAADCEKIPESVLNMLWTNHKLEAIDTPYGTCLQRTKGKCAFAKQPPCLTCNAGKPCKDLCVGVFEGDIHKYRILIASTISLIEQAKRFGRDAMARENEELLKTYQDIYQTISGGNLIYGRIDRLVG